MSNKRLSMRIRFWRTKNVRKYLRHFPLKPCGFIVFNSGLSHSIPSSICSLLNVNRRDSAFHAKTYYMDWTLGTDKHFCLALITHGSVLIWRLQPLNGRHMARCKKQTMSLYFYICVSLCVYVYKCGFMCWCTSMCA